VDVDVLDSHLLLPLPPVALQRLDLGREGSQELGGDIPVVVTHASAGCMAARRAVERRRGSATNIEAIAERRRLAALIRDSRDFLSRLR
jgi:hypothetical protein